jgi:thymidylate synthase (FAD)
MKASFAAVTQTSIRHEKEDRVLTPQEFIAYEARISSPHRQHLHESAENLLRYCLVNSHWSPFDMVDLTVEIETSRGIMAQILRHWSFRFQEFSQRYADPLAAGLGFEPVEMRLKHEGGNRQGSGEAHTALTCSAQELIAESGHNYASLIAAGVAPECARFVLTLATTTRGFMKGSVRSWMTYFWQRLDGHAQKEHRDLAWLAFDVFEEQFPLLAKIVLEGKPTYVDRSSIDYIRTILEKVVGMPGCPEDIGDSIEYAKSLSWSAKR